MAEKPVYTKPLSLEDLGYEPEELKELRKRHSVNWKDNSVNIKEIVYCSPATGYAKRHLSQQKKIIEDVFK